MGAYVLRLPYICFVAATTLSDGSLFLFSISITGNLYICYYIAEHLFCQLLYRTFVRYYFIPAKGSHSPSLLVLDQEMHLVFPYNI